MIFKPNFKTVYYDNTTFINVKRYLLNWIEYFIKRWHKVSHLNAMNITTINGKKNLT